ncbi:YfcE family phosphodiesterase [Candidatus Fermentibacterales bacterium]|nr:YfcE family phosphodiesterase [Candidatus Fermentibacterales bacterium]
MRLAIFGDVHGNLPGLEAAWRTLSSEGFDLALCTGDLVQYGPWPNEVVSFFVEHDVACVQGNCDRAVGRSRRETGDDFPNAHWKALACRALEWTSDIIEERSRKYLRDLPEELRFAVGRREILLTHGLPGRATVGFEHDTPGESADLLLQSASVSLMILGHTHSPLLVTRERGWIVNPGSVGGGSLPGAGTAALVEMDERKERMSVAFYRVSWDRERYVREYERAGLPDIFLRCLLLGRDPRGRWHTEDHRWRQRWAER